MAIIDSILYSNRDSNNVGSTIDESELHKNPLHQYASYNYLFTLSALGEYDLKNPLNIIDRAPTNVVARSAGIGVEDAYVEANEVADIISNVGLTKKQETYIQRSKSILNQNRDIYFESVNIETVHSFNPERRSAAVGKIKIILNEPTGVTLLEKLKAAAYNRGYTDHVDAPYLLTLEFKGFDEFGNDRSIDKNEGKKWIPIKIVRMNIKVDKAGATYDIDAIPYNEAGFLNRYNYVRTSIKHMNADSLRNFMSNFETALNTQNIKEGDAGLFTKGMEDKYKILVHKDFADKPLFHKGQQNTSKVPVGTTTQRGYTTGSASDIAAEASLETGEQISDVTQYRWIAGGQSAPGTAIIKVLEDAMLTLQPVQDVLESWAQKIIDKADKIKADTKETSVSIPVGEGESFRNETSLTSVSYVTGDAFQNINDKDYYVDWFIIKSSIETDVGRFDKKTMQHPKIITYFIEPYKIHVYRLARPGVTFGSANYIKVKKKYDYLFTGNNTDVLDLDINYKVAYYQSRLRPKNEKKNNETDPAPTLISTVFGDDIDIDNGLDLRSYPAGVKNSTSGIFGDENKAEADLFMDALANPQADMVKVDLKIIGDPAWIGVSQFFNLNITSSDIKRLRDDDGGEYDAPLLSDDMKSLLDAVGGSWNNKFRCFNFDTHDPIVRLNFVMPGDLNDVQGTYELGGTKSAMFSGLYQVYKVNSSFNSGAFTQTLHMTRFRNQSNGDATKPMVNSWVIDTSGKVIDFSKIDVSSTNEEVLKSAKNQKVAAILNSLLDQRKSIQVGKYTFNPTEGADTF